MTVNASKTNSSTGLTVSLHLDAPLNREEARSRGIDPGCSRFLIEGHRDLLANVLYQLCPENKTVFISAVGSFVPMDKLGSILKEKNISIFSEYGLVGAKGDEEIIHVLSNWDAEILVVFMSDLATATTIVQSLPKHGVKWWKFSNEGYEAPFLKQLSLADPFFFFSPTLSSLEILGSERQILNSFQIYLERQINLKVQHFNG